MANINQVVEEIKRYHIKGVDNKNITKLLSRRYKVRQVDIEIILYTLEATDYKWQKRRGH